MRVVREPYSEQERKPKFYEFTQNNSGGSFVHDAERGISHFVIIEAYSPQDANERAKSIGIYFDGCDTGDDCSCCGDRWYEQYSYSLGRDDGTEEPRLYDKHPKDVVFDNGYPNPIKWIDGPECYVHYINGKIEAYGEEFPSRRSKKSKKR